MENHCPLYTWYWLALQQRITTIMLKRRIRSPHGIWYGYHISEQLSDIQSCSPGGANSTITGESRWDTSLVRFLFYILWHLAGEMSILQKNIKHKKRTCQRLLALLQAISAETDTLYVAINQSHVMMTTNFRDCI